MANKKITELTEETSPAGADLLPLVDDVAGTPTTKKVTVTNLMTLAPQGDLEAANNLSDLNDAATARTNLGLGTAATSASTDFSSAFFSTVTESTTARTLSDSDNGKVIVCTNAAATNITIPNTLSSGFSCVLVQNGTSSVIAGAGTGVTLNAIGGKYATEGQYAAMRIVPVGTNSYVLSGSLAVPPYSNTYSLDFDGTNDYIVGTGSTLTMGTISCWFYNDDAISTSTTGQVIFSQGGSDFGICLGNQTGGLTDELIFILYGNQGFGYTATGGTISSGWHHVMMAWVSNSSTNPGNAGYDIWLDGVKVGNATTATPPTSADTLYSSGFYLGARGGTYRFFDGRIDEFALWTGDVSGDIANIYNGGNGAVDLSDSAVVGTAPNIWLRMGDNDGGSGTTVTDQGSAGINATVNGATFVVDTP